MCQRLRLNRLGIPVGVLRELFARFERYLMRKFKTKDLIEIISPMSNPYMFLIVPDDRDPKAKDYVIVGELGELDEFRDQFGMVFELVEQQLFDDLGQPQKNLEWDRRHDDAETASQHHDQCRPVDELSERYAMSAAVAAGNEQCRDHQHEAAQNAENGCQIHKDRARG